MAKNIDYHASVINGTNRIVGESHNDWNTIRPGSYIKFQQDPTYFTISNKKEFFFISPFTCDGSRPLLHLDTDCGIDIMKGDSVTITYKETEALNFSSMEMPGEGYAKGDIIEVAGGNQSIGILDNMQQPAIFKVESIDGNGGIQTLSIQERGRYLTSPDELVTLINGNGHGAKAKVAWTEAPQRQTVEKEVDKVGRTEEGKAVITLNYSLPKGVTKGKVSVKKWELLTSSPYNAGGKTGAICNITRDFSPNYKLPLMSDNQHPWLLNQEVAHNESISQLDIILRKLEDRIEKLEKGPNPDILE
jgi:hypothetical protein